MSEWLNSVYVSPVMVVLLLVAAGCVGYASHGLDTPTMTVVHVRTSELAPVWTAVPVFYNDLPRFVCARALDKGIAHRLMPPLRRSWP